jgi:hypothetical protein
MPRGMGLARHRRTCALALLAATGAVVALSGGCGGREEPERHTARLDPVNSSGVRGEATMAVVGDHLTLHVRARGLEPDRIHGQDIHGFVGLDEAPRCPRGGEDLDGSGAVEAAEAERAYGQLVERLEPFPTVGSDGRLDNELTYDANTRRLRPLVQRVLVLRGGTAERDGERQYVPTLPVACGRIGRAQE